MAFLKVWLWTADAGLRTQAWNSSDSFQRAEASCRTQSPFRPWLAGFWKKNSFACFALLTPHSWVQGFPLQVFLFLLVFQKPSASPGLPVTPEDCEVVPRYFLVRKQDFSHRLLDSWAHCRLWHQLRTHPELSSKGLRRIFGPAFCLTVQRNIFYVESNGLWTIMTSHSENLWLKTVE